MKDKVGHTLSKKTKEDSFLVVLIKGEGKDDCPTSFLFDTHKKGCSVRRGTTESKRQITFPVLLSRLRISKVL